MSERVFLEAKGLEDDRRLAITQFEVDKAQLNEKIIAFEEFHKSLGNFVGEMQSDVKVFHDKL